MDVFFLPALLVLLSAALRSFIVTKNSTPSIIGEIALGLPVDLTFVVLSIGLTSGTIAPYWVDNRSILIIGMLFVAIFQLGVLYKPCKEYIDEDKNAHSFGLWFLNSLVTLGVFAFFMFKVIK
ncbi:hypothetical protein ABRQ09_05765 [Pectobacterium brasiliense]|uniref:hypothetical protein n=1 Tax=Pectobacterium brasiliense TaxID=180957 RepID=UPI0032ED891C